MALRWVWEAGPHSPHGHHGPPGGPVINRRCVAVSQLPCPRLGDVILGESCGGVERMCTGGVRTDMRQPVKKVVTEYNQARARWSVVSRADLARTTKLAFDGIPVGLYREGTDLFPIIMRFLDKEPFAFHVRVVYRQAGILVVHPDTYPPEVFAHHLCCFPRELDAFIDEFLYT